MERSRLSEEDSLPGDGRGRVFVRIRKETSQVRYTHTLEIAELGTYQDEKDTDRTRHTHQLETAEGDLSGHGMKPTE